eukprot:TRINITY_DN35672_c0_g1_i1.p1 TRINITY_DN35672_c0_g1~~TRINITY_DN35672_c0_g1_i1.p1  ORF type:complete len:316 (-),score=33.99 TRINITY_DN35672_c0_g1_i1:21-968(-)
MAVVSLRSLLRYDTLAQLELLWWNTEKVIAAEGVFWAFMGSASIHDGRVSRGILWSFLSLICFLFAAAHRVPYARIHIQHWMGSRAETSSGAAVLGALLGSRREEDVVTVACDLFRCIRADELRKDIFDLSSPTSMRTVCTRSAVFGQVDAFVSHSWHDNIHLKWAALQCWRRGFKERYGREPLLWIDAGCIDQSKVHESLPSIPVFLAGCTRLLILCGETYSERLWCLFEIFVFRQIGKSSDQISVLFLYENTHQLEHIRDNVAAVDASHARCSKNSDRVNIMTALEAGGFDGLYGFNEHLRSTFLSLIQPADA